jgi:glycerol-3-phosphate dehydrogenase
VPPSLDLANTGWLSADARRDALAGMTAEPLDVLVVGGGVVGCGSAVDAVSRGLRVGLVERGDLAGGTSSRSSRLAHGGLRYLEQGEFGLVHEALTERGLLLQKLAPHLVRPVPFLLPLKRGWERPYYGAGVALYDVLARGSKDGRLPGHRHLSRRATLRLAPALRQDAVAGAIGFFDAQIDDARHTLALARTAAGMGALVATRTEVVEFLRDDDDVVGARVLDRLTGLTQEVRARRVISATGVWTSDTVGLLGQPAPATVLPSKGVHLVVPRDAIDARTAMVTRTPHSVLFLLPWGQHWLIGTTDTAYTGDRSDPHATGDEVEYLLDEANQWLEFHLTADDVVATYAGLRPLAVDEGDAADTTTVSREHQVLRPANGLVAITGGKYTTYRVMAADAVDAATEGWDTESATADLPLVGAEGFAQLWDSREFLSATHRLPEPEVRRLLHRYGATVDEVLAMAAGRTDLMQRVHPDSPVLRVEVLYAAAAEGAVTVDDVLMRRTRLALQVPDAARSAAGEVAGLLGEVLGWDADRVAAEADAYVRSAAGLVLATDTGLAAG